MSPLLQTGVGCWGAASLGEGRPHRVATAEQLPVTTWLGTLPPPNAPETREAGGGLTAHTRPWDRDSGCSPVGPAQEGSGLWAWL